MAREAERLLDGAGWLPEPLRVAQTGMEVDAPIGEVGEAELCRISLSRPCSVLQKCEKPGAPSTS